MPQTSTRPGRLATRQPSSASDTLTEDLPHTYSYAPDIATGLATLGQPLLNGDSLVPLFRLSLTLGLSFEHVPSKLSGNRSKVRYKDTRSLLELAPGVFPDKAPQQQKGMGLYGTCEPCNNVVSERYNKAYSSVATRLLSDLQAIALRDGIIPMQLPTSLQLIDVDLGSVFRQGLFMLCAASGGAGLVRHFPELVEILNGEALPLPQGLRVRLALVLNDDRARLGALCSEVTLDNNTERCIAEVASAPFAWLLEVGDPSPRTLADVSEWSKLSPKARHSSTVSTQIGFVGSPIPGDYRHPAEVA
jgi:hypothetical protein